MTSGSRTATATTMPGWACTPARARNGRSSARIASSAIRSASSSAGACDSAWPKPTRSSRHAPPGISIGHRDTDNLIRDNSITRSGKVGILFRDETLAFGPHRNRCEHNRIIDSGADDGVGIDVQGQTEAVTLTKNEVRETRKPTSRIGIRIGPKARDITLVDNQIEGYHVNVSDLREKRLTLIPCTRSPCVDCVRIAEKKRPVPAFFASY